MNSDRDIPSTGHQMNLDYLVSHQISLLFVEK